MNDLFQTIDGISAEFSPDETYRYTLTRQWDSGKRVAWLMFNPSTATLTLDDPTIRKCIGFSKRWGYARLVILNLYAIRSTDPRAVKRMGFSAIGPENNFWIEKSLEDCEELICSWGCSQHVPDINARVATVKSMIEKNYPNLPMRCLGYKKDGHPRHPLMIPYEMQRVQFEVK